MIARRVRSSTATRLRRMGWTSSGWTVCTSSRRSMRPTNRWRTTLIEPLVEPAEPPTNMSPTSVIAVSVVHVVKSVEAKPRRHDRHGLEDGVADRSSPRSMPSLMSSISRIVEPTASSAR